MPRALLFGVLIVSALYLAINAVYIYAVPVTANEGRVARVGSRDHGLIRLPDISVDNRHHHDIDPRRAQCRNDDRPADLLCDGAGWGLFKGLGRVHPRFGTPTSAIILQAAWTCLLLLTNTWGTLFTYVSVVITLFSAFTVGSVIVLRYKRPELRRPYKLWGYPIVPMLFIVIHLWIVWGSVKEKPFESLVGFLYRGARHSDLFRLAVAPPEQATS